MSDPVEEARMIKNILDTWLLVIRRNGGKIVVDIDYLREFLGPSIISINGGIPRDIRQMLKDRGINTRKIQNTSDYEFISQ
jgi:hypothetical protein